MEMLTPVFDLEGGKPLYRQLYEYIKSEIRNGNIECNAKLPSKRKLSTYLAISQNTIQAAYEQLMEEGYIEAFPKKGFFVSPIDNIISIDRMEEQTGEQEGDVKTYLRHDFSYHGVDHGSFPFAVWRRLARDVINEYDKDLLKPGSFLGDEKLRESISRYLLHSRGLLCSKDNIVISSGTESLFQILIQLLGKDHIYGIENPGYEKLNLLFKSNNAEFRTIDIDMQGMNPLTVDVSGADVICITPAHQFPLGGIMPISRRVKILNWAYEKPGRYIIEDDYDSEFKYSGKPVPALCGIDKYDKVIYMGSLSKSLSPSVRVSYMVLPHDLMKKYREKLSFIVCPVPAIDQKILQRFIEEGHFERHLNRMRNIYKRKREILTCELARAGDKLEIIGADAGLHLLVEVRNGMSEKELVERAGRAGVGVYGISSYYHDKRVIGSIPKVLLGFAGIEEGAIVEGIRLLLSSWF